MAEMMSFRVPGRTRLQMERLATRYHSMTAVVVAAVDKMYAQEVPSMLAEFEVVTSAGRSIVTINGVTADERLTPDLARRCVAVATGNEHGPADVWEASSTIEDWDRIGYHVTKTRVTEMHADS